ncbi:hypothetical protein [Streptomyces sp. NBC_01451]|uniref:hypothetical protein n=1 Tax=Streptomyces sp. NBC_01451 TaxID=2903872 RepID=UPI002E36A80A|nr:hypothetical protein [Streptomyces sp. NBC_01451]
MARRQIDPDSEFDTTACARKLLQGASEPSPAPQTAWTPPEPAPRRERRTRGRAYGPDSVAGLADYFTRACPPLSWAGGLEIGNRQALMTVFSELRHSVGLTPDDCRALVDLYVTRLGDRRPQRPYIWDFKWQRYQLLAALRNSGVTRTDADYQSWTETACTSKTEDEAFVASWEKS